MNKALGKSWGSLVAALDVGSTKSCCFIARVEGGGRLRVVGIGCQASRGVRNGVIVDMDAAVDTILNTIQAAEEMAKDTIREVFVSVGAGRPLSRNVSVDIPIGGHEIGDGDIRRALDQGRARCSGDGRELIHFIPLGFSIDGNRGIRQPHGMYGQSLGVDMHVISADPGPVRNLVTCVRRSHLDVDKLVVGPYAAGLSALVEDETDLGVTVIDMGGGTTDIAIFYDGNVIFTDSIPVGGGHVTNDIARGLSTPLNHAERIKTLYGSCMSSASDERELIDVPPIGEDDPNNANHVPKSIVIGIIQPRLEETFELVRARIEASGFDRAAGNRVVLVGGASQLQGVRELASLVLEKQVRMGRPMGLQGLAEATSGPAFATCAGLLAYAVREREERPIKAVGKSDKAPGRLGRVGEWIRQHL